MYLSKINRLLGSITLLAILLAGVFAAVQVTSAQASTVRTITLTIDNRAPSSISLWLEGADRYQLTVAGKTTKAYTINRDSYDYTLKGCGMTTKGEINLKSDTLMINPVCGGKIRTIAADPSKIDLGSALKVVPVTVSSELTYRTMVILTGPSTYVFTLNPDQDLKVTIAKGTYEVRYYACGVNLKKEFQAYKNAILYLRCP